MKNLFLLLLLQCGITAFAQTGDTNYKEPSIAPYTPGQSIADSINSSFYAKDSLQRQKDMERNIDSIVRLQKDNRAKQKKAATTRLAIGIALFAVLVIGLMRRRRKK